MIPTGEEFWDRVASTPYAYDPDGQVVNDDGVLPWRAQEFRDRIFDAACGSLEARGARNSLVRRYYDITPPRIILDLGAGSGSNSIPMLMCGGGAHVTAIDNSQKLLIKFVKQCAQYHCRKENVKAICRDITEMESYGENFDLVLAIDILSYLPPNTLRSTMTKIHSCLVNGGVFIGTICTMDVEPDVRFMPSQVGATFYEGNRDFAQQLLTESGFSVTTIERHWKDGYQFEAVKL